MSFVEGESCEAELRPDLIETAPLEGSEIDPVAAVPVTWLLTLTIEGVLDPDIFFLRKFVILRSPLLKPACRFRSMSVTMAGISKCEPPRADLLDRLVLGRRSLEPQDVGAVD